MSLFKTSTKKAGQLDKSKLPRHIAVIMDGNGRWAKKRNLPRTAGHAAGAETFRKIATYCQKLGVEYFTVYAFSTENWKRPPEEVDAIMKLLDKYLREAIEKMVKDNVRLTVFGDKSVLSKDLQELIEKTDELSKASTGMQVNICLNYGSRDEIIKAAKAYAEDYAENKTELTEELFSSYLYSKDVPDPDLVIRPSGEYRLSNFLMWQCAYSELYFTDVLWPDFTEKDMDAAIISFQSRDRRFGGIKK